MNQELMNEAGFTAQIRRVNEGKCPRCGKVVSKDFQFRDYLSAREFEISGFCQDCQDFIFGE